MTKILNSLENKEDFLEKSKHLKTKADLLLANINTIKPYQKDILIDDFYGNKIKMKLDETMPINKFIDSLYKKSKKLFKKADSIELEVKNLEQKIDFYEKFKKIIQNTTTKEELNILFPKIKKDKKEIKQDLYERFEIKGFLILLGKNKRANAKLLKEAKANDIWLHLKEQKSAHVIIKTNKSSIPQDVLENGAKLCARFSGKNGAVQVDYTQRRNVKIIQDADVEYKFYKTLTIKA